MRTSGQWPAVAFLSIIALPFPAFAVTVVDTCGQVVQGSAVLEADLDCSAAGSEQAVVLQGGTLNLGGFTITAPVLPGGRAIDCAATCRIAGPGTVRGGIYASSPLNLLVKVSDANIVANDADDYVVNLPGKVKLISVVATGQASGVSAINKTKLIDSHLTGNGAVGGYGNVGSSGGKTILVRSSITGFAYGGVSTPEYVRLIDSQVTGNGTDLSCVASCVDIASGLAPRLKGTATCGTSQEWPDGPTWGVCSND